MSQVPVPITVARGDGIGPEIMQATLDILEAGGAALDIDEITIGEAMYEQGYSAGIAPEAFESLRRTKVFLKAPITTPQGGSCLRIGSSARAKGLADRPSHTNSTLEGSCIAWTGRLT